MLPSIPPPGHGCLRARALQRPTEPWRDRICVLCRADRSAEDIAFDLTDFLCSDPDLFRYNTEQFVVFIW